MYLNQKNITEEIGVLFNLDIFSIIIKKSEYTDCFSTINW